MNRMKRSTKVVLRLLCTVVAFGGYVLAAKPTSAAAKKPAEDAAVEEKYQAIVAKLPPDEQAWERTLQANLGTFYLPIHKRERVKGIPNAWAYVKDDPKLPRVLLIGDSVSRGYTMAVRKALAGKANVHRAPENCGPTSNGLKKLDVWLGDGKWDVIHFNFGIHDRATPPAQYEERLERIVARLQKTGAKLVWASTTPIPKDEAKKQTPESIVERNAIAAVSCRGTASPWTIYSASSRRICRRRRIPTTFTSTPRVTSYSAGRSPSPFWGAAKKAQP